ncbi:MAG: dipeptidase [Parvibaculum sp.]|uniref:dipeptidase n=1 Tax=Parvibaculum sp. TaxID=2024848 RepID=UPI0025DF942E|nr:dipeptidase [Parvibaculum sp.]MCE9648134.1 dipeptidase [Parvibaculum sp.]
MKKLFLAGAAFLALTSLAFADDAALEAKARAIQSRIVTIDTHTDIPTFFATDRYDPGKLNGPPALVDIPRMKSGGLDAVFFIVYVDQTKRDAAGYAEAASEAFAKFAAIHRMTDEQYAKDIGLALTSADIRRIHAEGKRVALIGIENGYAIGRHPELLDIYYGLGARYFGLVHNGHNDIADSAQPQSDLGDKPNDKGGEHGGLSEYGREIVARCNDLGIMVDVSHSAKSTTLDAIAASRVPIIASHSAVYALNPHPRNMSDEEMKALAAKGGVIQIVAFDEYLQPMPKEKKAARGRLAKSLGFTSLDAFFAASPEAKEKFAQGVAEIDKKWPRANVALLADHIDYAVKLIGIDHVGIASDFQGGGGIAGWSNAGETFNVTKELVKRGYTEAEIGKLWGGNLMRVMDAVAAGRKP